LLKVNAIKGYICTLNSCLWGEREGKGERETEREREGGKERRVGKREIERDKYENKLTGSR